MVKQKLGFLSGLSAFMLGVPPYSDVMLTGWLSPLSGAQTHSVYVE